MGPVTVNCLSSRRLKIQIQSFAGVAGVAFFEVALLFTFLRTPPRCEVGVTGERLQRRNRVLKQGDGRSAMEVAPSASGLEAGMLLNRCLPLVFLGSGRRGVAHKLLARFVGDWL